MTRAACRCGQMLTVPESGSDRVVCPNCGARVRVRQAGGPAAPGPGQQGDGYIRFFCSCGRRLKVDAARPPSHGKCPDCGKVVPVPDPAAEPGAVAGPGPGPMLPPGHPESPTQELAPADLALLDAWSKRHLGKTAGGSVSDPDRPTPMALPAERPSDKIEAGLRVCPRCGRPVHLGSVACRECGAHVPKR